MKSTVSIINMYVVCQHEPRSVTKQTNIRPRNGVRQEAGLGVVSGYLLSIILSILGLSSWDKHRF